MKYLLLLSLITILASSAFAQTNTAIEYPINPTFMSIYVDGVKRNMAFMDAAAEKPNGKTVILFHGKNFNGYYWKDVIPMLTSRGYRVIVPDQFGWGKSDRPDTQYSFHRLAEYNMELLKGLGIKQVLVIGHSMGGMLATRFTLMYPELVDKLVLENPIGLEDYRTFVPYQSLEDVVRSEQAATYESYLNYQKTYYPEWKPENEQYVKAQAADLTLPNFKEIARVNALTFKMIYEQPVCYEFGNIKVPTLLIIGQADRTIVGKNRVPKDIVNNYGQYPKLGRDTAAKIKNSQLIELEGIGHIPHIQSPDRFEKAVADFLTK
jgi:pimeloyl-ACP methyl ester carboxylesterase